MAIYYCNVSIVGRSAGKSVVAAAAYRAGERLHDARPGMVHDFGDKAGVLRAADVSAEAVTIVELLTKPALLAYLSWVRRIAFSGHHSAVRVKLADNEDNAAQARIRTWADRERLAQRYQPTRAILLQALRGDRSR